MKKGLVFTIIGMLFFFTMAATDITLNIYKTDKSVQKFMISNVDSVKIDSKDSLLFVHKKDGSFSAIAVAEIDSMNYSSEDFTVPTLETVSADYNYTSGKAVCTVNVASNGGCELTDRGICWSTTQTPTINDNKYSSGTYSTGQFYALMSSLALNGTYYVRGYATNGAGTAYGNAIMVKPMMGNVTYTLAVDQAIYPEYYKLLKIALDSACYYYNRYTSFKANIYVYYNAGIPTAQANYHGSIGFGPSTSYMWVGTTMHEMAHFFGSGTSTVWKSKMVSGIWQGTNGLALCLQLTGATLKGDNSTSAVHYWPTGVNYRSEVSSATDLINHARIIQAMLVDDCALPTSW